MDLEVRHELAKLDGAAAVGVDLRELPQPRVDIQLRHQDLLEARAVASLEGLAGWRRMIRTAFVMQLNDANHLPEYIKRHDGTDPHYDGPKAQVTLLPLTM
jgi:hypothetical protein